MACFTFLDALLLPATTAAAMTMAAATGCAYAACAASPSAWRCCLYWSHACSNVGACRS